LSIFNFFQGHGERNVLIVDLGGGTFDVSIINIKHGYFEVKAVGGNSHLGGEDFDSRMVSYFEQEFKRKYNKDLTSNKRAVRRLRTACEKAKCMLSDTITVDIVIDCLIDNIDFSTTVTRARFEDLNADLFRSTMEIVDNCLWDAKMDKSQIHDIVLVGGSTRIIKVQEMLKEFFNGKELKMSVNPDEAVAYGAAVLAAILDGELSAELKDLRLVDVTPLSLGIETVGGEMYGIIPRNTAIPTKKTRIFSTGYDNQQSLLLKVYEGEREMVNDNNLLGKFELTGIPPAPRGVLRIEVTFDIDANGILNVTAVEMTTGIQSKITITHDIDRPSEEEFERSVNDADKYRAEDEKEEQRIYAMNVLKAYCVNMKSRVQDEIHRFKISDADKNTVLYKCNLVIRWLEADRRTKEQVECKQKELDTECNPIMKRLC
jgi:L1 cell adhesion molecule like protein